MIILKSVSQSGISVICFYIVVMTFCTADLNVMIKLNNIIINVELISMFTVV